MELPNLSSLIKNSKAPIGRKRRISEKIIRRRLEIVDILNSPLCQTLNCSHIAKILKTSSTTINRDVEWLAKKNLIFPLREKELPYNATETATEYITRFLAALELTLDSSSDNSGLSI